MNASTGNTPLPWHFHGKAEEFFRIWLVNVSLSIITLGIYTAWAKVRTTRYFYGNTKVDGHGFDYHASPKQILKGRVVGAVLFIGYQFIEFLPEWLILPVLGICLFAMPWLINSSIRFHARMTSYRGIRFGFGGTYLKSLWVFVIFPALGWISLGLLMPFSARAHARYLAGNYSFGDRRFSSDPPLGGYIKAYFLAGLLFAVVSAAILALFGGFEGIDSRIQELNTDNLTDDEITWLVLEALLLFFMAMFFGNLFVFQMLKAWTTNLLIDHLAMEKDHRFQSRLSAWRYAWIAFSNWALALVTFGLAIPWAKVRMARYRAACTTMLASGDIASINAGLNQGGSAIGQETSDLFDVDIAI